MASLRADVLGMRRALTFHVDDPVLGRVERLKFKSRSGEDHFDTAALSAMGILLPVNSGFNAVSVAEHAVTMILLCLRRTHDCAALMRHGGCAFGLPGDTPTLLAGKTAGLVGVGAIGIRIARAMIARRRGDRRPPRPAADDAAGASPGPRSTTSWLAPT